MSTIPNRRRFLVQLCCLGGVMAGATPLFSAFLEEQTPSPTPSSQPTAVTLRYPSDKDVYVPPVKKPVVKPSKPKTSCLPLWSRLQG